MSISTSIKLLQIFLSGPAPTPLPSSIRSEKMEAKRNVLEKRDGHVPIFSTSQGNVKVSPTTALYVCPCEINLGCDVDDVVASDLLPRKKRQEKEKIEKCEHGGMGNLNLFSLLRSLIDKLSTIKISGRKLHFSSSLLPGMDRRGHGCVGAGAKSISNLMEEDASPPNVNGYLPKNRSIERKSFGSGAHNGWGSRSSRRTLASLDERHTVDMKYL